MKTELDPTLPSQTYIVLKPEHRWFALDLSDLWHYRELLYFITWRDVKVRYKQTMVVFSIIFGKLAKLPSAGIPYPIFTYTALLPWQLFAFALTNSSNSLVGSQNLISKVYFPRLVIPIASVLPGLVDFAIAFVVLLGMMFYYHISITVRILILPVFILFGIVTALAMGFWLSALNVEYRDIRYVVPFMTLFWQYATPVAYSSSLIPERWRVLYALNPMVGVVEGFRWAVLGKGEIGCLLWVSVGIVLLLLLSGLIYFKHMEDTFADVI